MLPILRTVFIGRDAVKRQVFNRSCIHELNMPICAAFTRSEEALSFIRTHGCDAVYIEGTDAQAVETIQKIRQLDPFIRIGMEIDTIDGLKPYVVSFTEETYSDCAALLLGRLLFEDTELLRETAYQEILHGIDQHGDPWERYAGLPDPIKAHSERVADLTEKLAVMVRDAKLYEEDTYETMELRPECIGNVRKAALLHDVGKAYLPAELLQPDRFLTRAERMLTLMHTVFSERLLEAYQLPLMVDEDLTGDTLLRYMAQEMACNHHEHFDGTGLPYSRYAGDCSLWARLCQVANAFDVLTHEGLHGEALDAGAAVGWIGKQAGKWFDPAVCEVFETYGNA